MLQARELDGKALFEVTHHPPGNLAKDDIAAQIGPMRRGNARAGQREVDDPDPNIGLVGQNQLSGRVLRDKAAVAAVFRQVEKVAVGEPGELGGQLIAFARRGCDCHGKAIGQMACDLAFETAEMVNVGDNPVPDVAAHRRNHGHAARGHVEDLAAIFLAVGQYIAAQEIDAEFKE